VSFPRVRPRRRRRTPELRALVRETRLAASDLILPLFVAERDEDAVEVAAMPGVVRHSLAALDAELDRALAAGIRAVLLFGVPGRKDSLGTSASDADGIVARALRRIRERRLPLVAITDVCLCAYADHGHCGVLDEDGVANDASLDRLAAMAACHAEAGADLVAPSAMMDGMVAALRSRLDADGHQQVGILSYAVKYASAFYGPFREAAQSAPRSGDRRGYQMDPGNAREALLEARLDAAEGADLLMVKPALPYLDVVRRVKDAFPELPLVGYQVSGEYAMIRAAAALGVLDERAAALESLLAIRRAGADAIVTYFAKEAAAWLRS
jgi:porphobilinogen synthase